MNIDKLFSDVTGELGFQQKVYCFICFMINLYTAFQMLQYKFAVSKPSYFTCSLGGGKMVLSSCPENLAAKCGTIEYAPGEEYASAASEWDLVCDQEWLGPLSMSIFMTGVMIGAVALGYMADKLGRKRTLSITFIAMVASNTVAAFAPSFRAYCVFRFMCGFFQSGVLLSTFVLMNELVGASKRGTIGVVHQLFFAAGIAFLSLLAYFTRHNWRNFTLSVTVIGLPFVYFVVWYLPESPRWLQSKGRYTKAVEVLKHITLKNGRKWKDVKEDEDGSRTSRTGLNAANSDGIVQLLTNRETVGLTLIQIYSWFANSASYYGLTLAAGQGGGDLYLMTTMSGLVEIPAYILTLYLLPMYGRRKTTVMFMVVGGAACAAISLINGIEFFEKLGVKGGLALLGKLCISASFAVIYLHSNEIFPTSIRNGAMGLVSFAARIGGTLSPYLAELGTVIPNLHFFIFGVMALTSGLLNVKLPETQGRPMPETIEDLARLKAASPASHKYTSLSRSDV